MNDYQPTDDKIRPKAHQIAQALREAGDLHWNDSFGNWIRAREVLIAEFEENWTRGTVGE